MSSRNNKRKRIQINIIEITSLPKNIFIRIIIVGNLSPGDLLCFSKTCKKTYHKIHSLKNHHQLCDVLRSNYDFTNTASKILDYLTMNNQYTRIYFRYKDNDERMKIGMMTSSASLPFIQIKYDISWVTGMDHYMYNAWKYININLSDTCNEIEKMMKGGYTFGMRIVKYDMLNFSIFKMINVFRID